LAHVLLPLLLLLLLLLNLQVAEVIGTAMRLIGQMKRDWMQTGRRPAGVRALNLPPAGLLACCVSLPLLSQVLFTLFVHCIDSRVRSRETATYSYV
jgi:transcription initiation factor TFIIIB Brf1 subunit/transcription initiation factor TFIIB